MTTSAGRWAAATASVRGAAHERDGRPNQDAVRIVTSRGAAAGLVAAVCDGHGGARYVRSDVGSRLGVEVSCEVGRRALDQLGSAASVAGIGRHLAGPVAESIVARWRERVLDDVRRRPFTDDERTRAAAPLDDDPLVSYGCTLLLAIFGPTWIGLLQIGDGDVTVVRGGRGEAPVPDDERLVGGETTSLCLPTAVADARVAAIVEPLPDAVFLTSDGYANSFASPTWRTDAGADLCDHAQRMGIERTEQQLPGWLADSAAAGGDDVSMAFVQRLDADVRAAPVHADTTSAPAAASPTRRGRGRGAVAGVVAAAAIAGVGIGIGWVLSPDGDAAAPPPSSVTSIAATTIPVVTSTTVATAPVDLTTLPAPTTSTLALSPDHELMLFQGEGIGVVVYVDRDGVELPQLVAQGPANREPQLPQDWVLKDGGLRSAAGCWPALAVVGDDELVFWIDPDGRSLHTYVLREGAERKVQVIVGRPDPPQSPGDEVGCETPDETVPGDTGPTAETEQTTGN